ncbi:C-C chemokine receptor type 6-like [Oreochromis aureus]|uniref:G-protein coupled receptors family 1 profile domain-containing protein n=1 Tax=Oreochromis aureus TaxID=47969 RepID=A0A668S662_OREAU|nr:C-C chemokine receptor type 6-like [Oreochromis aureus]XP_039475049.1 C-C chemokine receptor type 6-like [Oreochromis aureus]
MEMFNQSYSMEMSYYEYYYNVSDYLDYDGFCLFHNNQNVVKVIIHSIFCILGLVGNSLVIVTYAFYKRIKCMTDIYLINVAVADLLFVLALPFIVYNELWSWPMGQVACKLLHGSYSVNLYSGMLLLACISTDRYIAIAQARHRRWLSYSSIICAIVWIFAILVSVPTFYFYNWYEPSYMNGIIFDDDNQTDIQSLTPVYVCEIKFEDPATAVKVAVPITQISVGFFLPLFIMIFCFSGIIITLHKAKTLQHHRAVWVMLVVVAVFIICHLPYNILLLYDMVTMFQERSCEEADMLQMALTVSQTIAYMHCCLNPMLYAFVGVNFRNHFRRIFRDLWCLGKAPHRFSRVTSDLSSTPLHLMDGSSNSATSFTM